MEVKSILKYWSYVNLVFLLCFLAALRFIIPFYSLTNNVTIYFYLFSIGSIIYVFYWTLKGLIDKANAIFISDKGIYRKKFLGLGKTLFYSFEIYNHYEVQKIRSKYKEYDFLYLVKEDKKYNICNSYFHKNYKELQKAIQNYIENR